MGLIKFYLFFLFLSANAIASDVYDPTRPINKVEVVSGMNGDGVSEVLDSFDISSLKLNAIVFYGVDKYNLVVINGAFYKVGGIIKTTDLIVIKIESTKVVLRNKKTKAIFEIKIVR